MPNKNKKTFASYFTKKVVWGLSVIVVLFSIVGGIWSFDDHYATNKRVDQVEEAHASNIDGVESKVGNTIENVERKLDVRFFQFIHEQCDQSIFELKKQIRRFPDDPVLKQDYDDALNRRNIIKQKLDEAIEKIKVN